MKNYVIGFLVICLIVSISFVYKASQSPVLTKFPIDKKPVAFNTGEPPLFLYIFFSKHSCPVCLEAIQVLNRLTPPFVVTGIVPAKELKNEKDLRLTSGATFQLTPYKECHKRFNPHYNPAIFGVSGKGNILFILPGVPGEGEYLHNFLTEFYGKSIELLIPGSNQ